MTTKWDFSPLTETKFTQWERMQIRFELVRKRLNIDWEIFAQDRLTVFDLILILIFA